MPRLFPAHATEAAPEEARPALTAALEQLGLVPAMIAKFAEAPLPLQVHQTAAGSLRQDFVQTDQTPGRATGSEPSEQLRLPYERPSRKPSGSQRALRPGRSKQFLAWRPRS
jgi:hypothetical protein